VDKPPVYLGFHLIVTKAKIVGSGWIVEQFKGTYTVSFSCPGSVACHVQRERLHRPPGEQCLT
jgi:hypothetical protein